MVVVSVFIFVIFIFSVCGIQHLQRGGAVYFDLFDSLWFVIVTFSTVGYGDIYPDIWPSKLFMMMLIAAAFIVLPTQVCISVLNGQRGHRPQEAQMILHRLSVSLLAG